MINNYNKFYIDETSKLFLTLNISINKNSKNCISKKKDIFKIVQLD